MKKNIFQALLIFAAIFTVMIYSCKKTTPASTQISVGFHFHSWMGGPNNVYDPAQYPTEWYADSTGRIFNFSTAQFYISNIAIHTTTGGWQQPQPGLVIIKRINNEVYPLGTINFTGLIDTVKYTVGLGNALNSQSPSGFSNSSAIDSVLASDEQATMWGSGIAGMAGLVSGYTFMNIQGRDSTDHLNLNYQLGGYGDTVNIVLTYPGGFSFVPVLPDGEVNFIHMAIDYGTLFQALPAMNSGNTNSTFYGSSPTPANTLLQYLRTNPNVIHWECTPPINC